MYDFDTVSQMATLTEDLEYDYFMIGDHFLSSEKDYVMLGWDPGVPTKLDAWSTLHVLALKTSKIKIGPCVSPLPFYTPSRLARLAASVDLLSRGRIIIGLGTGRNKKEVESYGIKWDEFSIRVEKLCEGIQIIRKMHSEDGATFRGKHYSINNVSLYPKPIQKPYPPIWIGGYAEPLIEIAVKHCEGWVIAGLREVG
jgi:alkanesulfonate monooxygenase SsuD/methylene tetrahydromethanopterin reductase-like flavin-dependent oxidoreductase (luciferase family)